MIRLVKCSKSAQKADYALAVIDPQSKWGFGHTYIRQKPQLVQYMTSEELQSVILQRNLLCNLWDFPVDVL